MSPPQKWAPKQTPSGKREEEQEDWKSFFNLEDHEEGRPGGSAEQQQQQQSSQGPAVSSQSSPARRQAKKPRRSKNSPEPDYSAVVQNQMAGTNRTGQACDRCKARKMKCDSNPSGCANCSASNSTCTQTDPITRESHTRGELESLRTENQRLRQENQNLRQELERLRPPMAAIFPRNAQQGHFQAAGPGGYSSMQDLTPQPLRQGMTVYPFNNMNVSSHRTTLAGRGAGQPQFGPSGLNFPSTEGYRQDPFTNGDVNRASYAPMNSTAQGQAQGYAGENPHQANATRGQNVGMRNPIDHDATK